jgi:hypothetical protein
MSGGEESSSSSYTWQQKWDAIAPKPFALLSIFCSAYIIKHILSNQTRRRQVVHHIILGLSLHDLIYAIAMFLGTWPIPRGTPNVYLASGTDQTCTAQAFFQQVAIACPLYSTALAIYYLFVGSYGWKEHKLKKYEFVLFHFIPNAVGFATAIVGLAKRDYGNATLWCWIADHDDRLIYGYAVIWACMLAMIVIMATMYWKVLSQERKVEKYRFRIAKARGANNTVRSEETDATTATEKSYQKQREQVSASRKVANQAAFWIGAFLLSFIFGFLLRLFQNNRSVVPDSLYCLMTIFTPLQGFFNALVYFRPIYLSRHPDSNFCRYVCGCDLLLWIINIIRKRVFGESNKAEAVQQSCTPPSAANL